LIRIRNNHPAYSIGTQNKNKLLILCKAQANALKGANSPGVGKYGPEMLKLKVKAPIATIGREKRFKIEKDKEFLK
jgi:hypothetical protein